MTQSREGWRATAGYLYVLHLPAVLLAWEYLRRNAHYQKRWRLGQMSRDEAVKWGLQFRRGSRPRRASSQPALA